MRAWIGVTDPGWFEFLRRENPAEEVNFWKPSGEKAFRAILPGELFLFKKGPFIVGGGVFGHGSHNVPCSLAWQTFERLNGAPDLATLRDQIVRHRAGPDEGSVDYRIGCRVLLNPFFLKDSEFLDVPPDWGRNYGPGFIRDLSIGAGRILLEKLRPFLHIHAVQEEQGHAHVLIADTAPRFGAPFIARARLGQGAFRMLITDAYDRRCAVTGERTLPALEAAHIHPVAKGGGYTVNNGLLLRADLHTLFDAGYVTVTPEYRFKVSRRIREEYQNGKVYYAFQDQPILLPRQHIYQPDREHLAWHGKNRFLA